MPRTGRRGARQALQERAARAAEGVHAALGLPRGRNDTTLLRAAVDEAVAEEVARNERLAGAIRARYDEMAGRHGTSARRPSARAQRAGLEPLVVLRHSGRPINSAVPPDPRELIWSFGPDKLGRALHEYTVDTLKLVAERVQGQHPGTRPRSRASRQALIDYIVAHTPTDIGDWNPSMLGAAREY